MCIIFNDNDKGRVFSRMIKTALMEYFFVNVPDIGHKDLYGLIFLIYYLLQIVDVFF